MGISRSNVITWANKDEARDVYIQMLEEQGVSWKVTWDQALKLVINDFRYNNAIKSMNERKHVFIAWSKQKERKERNARRQRHQRVRMHFLQLLEHSVTIEE